jgi:hypothetical protein
MSLNAHHKSKKDNQTHFIGQSNIDAYFNLADESTRSSRFIDRHALMLVEDDEYISNDKVSETTGILHIKAENINEKRGYLQKYQNPLPMSSRHAI